MKFENDKAQQKMDNNRNNRFNTGLFGLEVFFKLHLHYCR